MLSPRLAHRYAKSLLDLAQERKELPKVIKDMQLLQETINGSKDLRVMLKSPVIPTDKKEKVMHAIFDSKISEITFKFINLLVVKGREKLLNEVVDSFINLYNKKNFIVEAKFITAVPVDQKTVDEVTKLLLTNKTTKEVNLTNEVDPSIIGGFILKFDDLLLDNSVERKLHLIKKQLQDNSYISKI